MNDGTENATFGAATPKPDNTSDDTQVGGAESDVPQVPVPDDILAQAGLDTFQPGDVVFAHAKLTLGGDGNQVTGFSVDGLGQVTDKAPAGATFTDLSAGGEADENGDMPSDDEESAGDDNSDDPAQDDDSKKAETEMLGYRRPNSTKKTPPGFASAKSLLGE